MKHFPAILNFTAALLLLILGVAGYFSSDWFFGQKYDVRMSSPQSSTILRVMMGFMATIGGVLLGATIMTINQRRLLFVTGTITTGFIVSRLGGLILDGFDQKFTYIELSFELFALFVILWVYHITHKT